MALPSKFQQIKDAAEADLVTFIKLISPKTILGGVHEELCRWWSREDAKSHQMTLLPRDHQKSRMIAYRVAWEVTRNPEYRILYISSTANLAEKQLKFIKDIFTSEIYRRYWPEMVHPEEGKREKWTSSEIAIDHPKRKEESVRDPTIFTGGLTTSLTGLHCDIAVLDDVVVYENAYTNEGRDKVKSQYSLLSSIEGTNAREWVVGTRYHPKDLYNDLISMEEDIYDKHGELIGKEPIYEVFERQVESRGDGTGEFLWPRQSRGDGKFFGFDTQILSKKRAQYLDRSQFRAQYYNDPNDPDSVTINKDKFQYYDRKFLTRVNSKWYYKDRKLNVFAAIDFAYSLNKRSDYTALVVVGIDYEQNIYILDIVRFQTEKISEYYKEILNAHIKWDFRKIRAEVTAAQSVIVKELKNNYISKNGIGLSVDEHRPTRWNGSKEDRMRAALEPRYDAQTIWHYMGGNCQILEEELLLGHPPHDDVKDALAAVLDICIPPTRNQSKESTSGMYTNKSNIFNGRFGGVGF